MSHLRLILILVAVNCITACATRTSVECFRGDVRGTYSSGFDSKNGCKVEVRKLGRLDKSEADAIKAILEASGASN